MTRKLLVVVLVVGAKDILIQNQNITLNPLPSLSLVYINLKVDILGWAQAHPSPPLMPPLENRVNIIGRTRLNCVCVKVLSTTETKLIDRFARGEMLILNNLFTFMILVGTSMALCLHSVCKTTSQFIARGCNIRFGLSSC